MIKKAEELQKGDRVLTLPAPGNDGFPQLDFISPRTRCRTGEGIVKKAYNGHGLCFDIVHDDGTTACYNADEVEYKVKQ